MLAFTTMMLVYQRKNWRVLVKVTLYLGLCRVDSDFLRIRAYMRQ